MKELIQNAKVRKPKRLGRTRKVCLILASILLAIIIVFAAAIAFICSGDNLERIISKRASEYFDADVRVRKVSFSILTTWPHLYLEVDSVDVVSRSLHKKGVAPKLLNSLPANADSLLSIKHLSGSVNLIKLFANKVELKQVVVSGSRLNMVTLNDSVNNFNIFPESDVPHLRIPYISAQSIAFRNNSPVTYFSAADSLSLKANLKDMRLKRAEGKDNYFMDISGNLDAGFSNIRLCSALPFHLNGLMHADFHPMALSFHKMRFGLANLSSRMSLSLALGNEPALSNLGIEIAPFQLMKLLEFIPSELIPDMSSLSSDISAQIQVTLTKPYSFAQAGLPSFKVDCRVPSSSATYSMHDGTSYHVDDLKLAASFNFRGEDWKNSYCTISSLSARGEGMQIAASGHISSLWDDPVLQARLHADACIKRPTTFATPAGNFSIRGDANLSCLLSTHLQNLNSIADVVANGDVMLHDVDIKFQSYKGHIASADINFANDVNTTRASALMENINFVAPQAGKVTARKGKLTFAMPTPNLAPHLQGNFDRISYTSSIASIRQARIRALSFDYAAPSVIRLTAENADVCIGDSTRCNLKNASAISTALSDWNISADSIQLLHQNADPTIGLIKALALSVKADLNSPASRSGHAGLKIPSIRINSDMFPAGINLSDIDAAWIHNDSLALRSFKMRAASSAIALSGSLVRSAATAAPDNLRIRLNLDADTLQANQLAHIWQSGSAYIPKTYVKVDNASPAMLTPKNIDLKVKANAKCLVYTDLWLSNLTAAFTMNPEHLALDTVALDAQFGHAALSLDYRCPSARELSMLLNASVDEFSLQRFFKYYPKVLAMMPQMENLHGIFNASASASVELFPSMQFNVPSLLASVTGEGVKLYVHQTPFIAHIAHMAMIHQKGDIFIPDLHFAANIYDNTINLSPFEISLPGYRFTAIGRNDFQGNLDYHLAINHNPLIPFSFGVNIKGSFSHPHLSFGRARWNANKAMLTNGINRQFNINLISQLRNTGIMLLHHAAKAGESADTQ